jgi:hypothetical protein
VVADVDGRDPVALLHDDAGQFVSGPADGVGVFRMAFAPEDVDAVPGGEIPVRAAIADLDLHHDPVRVRRRPRHVHDLEAPRARDL